MKELANKLATERDAFGKRETELMAQLRAADEVIRIGQKSFCWDGLTNEPGFDEALAAYDKARGLDEARDAARTKEMERNMEG